MCIKLFHKEPRPDFTRRPHVRNVLYYCFPPKKDNEADDTNILISQSDKISIEIKNRPPTLNSKYKLLINDKNGFLNRVRR
jgi:hypothetical protein